MGDKEDYLTSYREFFENFATTVNPEDQLPVNIAGYTITESELPGEVIYWTTQYLAEKQCPPTLLTPLLRIILDEVRIASKKHPSDFGYKNDEGVYIALRLMQAVTARVNDVCLRYLDNSQLDTLPPPPAHRELKTVSIATKNSRRVMEDRHVEIGNLEALFGIETTEPTSLYAVYDGHAGSAAATYCAAHLHQYLVESHHFRNDLQKALHDAFLRTDAEFVRKSNQERACGGSTAVAVALRGRRLLAAWAGDSQALLAKRMRLMQLVCPHKPGRQDERERIESTGGTVVYWGTWRVNGQLAVSRAIGDAQYKPYVTALPETTIVELDGDEDFVVVACDGLWDFVSEDDVALSVYHQLSADPDDLKAVTKRLVVQAKRLGSADNISIIVVFLKEPRDIAAHNRLPMDLGLDNALASAPPFVIEPEACKRVDATAMDADADADCGDADADNGVENSDSDSEDLGPETAVDVDLDVDDNIEAEARNHVPQAPTPPAHTVEENHVDGALVDNVAESGEESEDEWNYFKGEGEREPREEADEPPRSETPCQDNSGWETSSVDMNSSPLNPDAPVFVPGGVGDVVLAESPRKPLPMDDIDLPDVAQFRTEAGGRPNDLLDLDNCDQLNGHHNVSIENTVKEHLNGNNKCNMDSLGFGFDVGIDSGKVNDTGLIQDFERIQKDTTDFCNIQVFQSHTETNPFADDGNEELFERLKNKERDPMSMSFYQEKDDDTTERFGAAAAEAVDLNAVQLLPEFDDDEPAPRDDDDDDKENRSPLPPPHANHLPLELHAAPDLAHTDTPESHKLLFEQIPEIPDGKTSELGFAADADAVEVASPAPSAPSTADLLAAWAAPPAPATAPPHTPDQPLDAHQDTVADVHHAPGLQDPAERLTLQQSTADAAADLVTLSPIPPTRDSVESPLPVRDESPQPTTEPAESPLPAHEPVQLHEPARLGESPEPTHETIQTLEPTHELAASPLPVHEPVATPEPTHEAMESPPPTHEPIESPRPPHETVESPQPTHEPIESPQPPHEPIESPLPTHEPIESPLPTHEPIESPQPTHHPVATPEPTHELLVSPHPAQEPVESPQPPRDTSVSPLPTESPAPATPVEPAAAPASPAPEPSGPAPDIVPEEPSRSELITDIDIGIPESHAQEICVPVTNEIQNEEIEMGVRDAPPAAPLAAAAADADAAPPSPAPAALMDSPIVADIAAPAAAAATAAAVVGAAAAVAKAKTPSSGTKKSTTTPRATASPATKSTTKSTAATTARTPTSASRKPAPTTLTAKAPAAPKTTPTRTAVAAAKSSPRPTAAAKPAAPAAPRAPPAKTTSVAAKPAPAAPKPAAIRAPATTKSAPLARPAPTKETATAPRTTAASRSTPAVGAAAATKPAARPATAPRARQAPAPTAARPAAPAAPRPRPADKKPLTNGDVKAAPARPAPRPAAAPAPRPPPRAVQPAAPKSAAPKPAPRATRPAPPKDVDKQNKDLANRRITAKSAPPRTVPPKTAGSLKSVSLKGSVKRTSGPTGGGGADVPAVNGAALVAAAPVSLPEDSLKPPPSPPAADNALLPDVIA